MKLQSIPTMTLAALLAIAFPGTALADGITSSESSSGDTLEVKALNGELLDYQALTELRSVEELLAEQQADEIVRDFIEQLDYQVLTEQQNRQESLESPSFGYRARKCFDTSFTGRDRLRTRIEAGNLRNIGSMGD